MNGRTLNPEETPPKGAWRSQLGYVVTLLGGPLEAVSRRQHSTALDTPSSEIFAASTCAAVLIHMQGVFRFLSFGTLGTAPIPLWCDNEVAVGIGHAAASVKRIAYIARRASFLQEVNGSAVKLLDIPGTANPADVFTKFLKLKEQWFKYCAWIYNTAISRFRT